MSENILCFEIASIPIFFILIISTIFRGLTKGRSNKLLMGLIVLSFISALSDVVFNLADQICFVLKESGYDSVGEGLDDNIRKLSLQGYKLSLDGYGNGYANIKHLVELPFSSVGLDTSMVAEATNEGGKALLAGVIQMLKNIPLEVIVQGVDDIETKEMLASMECDLMQGEFFIL